jgi:hypothetical protein
MSIDILKKESLKHGGYVSQERLGTEYFEAGNYEQAVYWWTLAAQQGCFVSQYKLAQAYDKGWGVKKNHEEAVQWAKRAARQDHEQAQEWLGNMYATTDSTYNRRTMYWYTKAASRGSAIAHEWLANSYKENPEAWVKAMLDSTTYDGKDFYDY